MLEAYMYTGLRSPFGRHAGALARLRPDDMLAGVIAKVVAESGFAPDKIEDVVVGCANQAGEDSRCVARHAALVAGLPIEIPGSVLQRKYAAAKADGFYAGEIIAVEVPGGRAGPVTVGEDEHPRPQTDLEALAKLRPLFKDGITTAGNASGINDGAVAMIIASRKAGDAAGVRPIARILSTGVAGVEPRIMGYGPVPAAMKALERAGLSIKDIDVIEINEAFAAQVLACLRGLEVPFDDSRVNPNGGAIAIGHPLGASGPRIALTAARQLQRTGGRYALIAMCVGVGQGIAPVLERV